MGKVLVIDPLDTDTDVLVVEVWEDVAGGAPVAPAELDGGIPTSEYSETYDGGLPASNDFDLTIDGGTP